MTALVAYKQRNQKIRKHRSLAPRHVVLRAIALAPPWAPRRNPGHLVVVQSSGGMVKHVVRMAWDWLVRPGDGSTMVDVVINQV